MHFLGLADEGVTEVVAPVGGVAAGVVVVAEVAEAAEAAGVVDVEDNK